MPQVCDKVENEEMLSWVITSFCLLLSIGVGLIIVYRIHRTWIGRRNERYKDWKKWTDIIYYFLDMFTCYKNLFAIFDFTWTDLLYKCLLLVANFAMIGNRLIDRDHHQRTRRAGIESATLTEVVTSAAPAAPSDDRVHFRRRILLEKVTVCGGQRNGSQFNAISPTLNITVMYKSRRGRLHVTEELRIFCDADVYFAGITPFLTEESEELAFNEFLDRLESEREKWIQFGCDLYEIERISDDFPVLRAKYEA